MTPSTHTVPVLISQAAVLMARSRAGTHERPSARKRESCRRNGEIATAVRMGRHAEADRLRALYGTRTRRPDKRALAALRPAGGS